MFNTALRRGTLFSSRIFAKFGIFQSNSPFFNLKDSYIENFQFLQITFKNFYLKSCSQKFLILNFKHKFRIRIFRALFGKENAILYLNWKFDSIL